MSTINSHKDNDIYQNNYIYVGGCTHAHMCAYFSVCGKIVRERERRREKEENDNVHT